MNRVIHAALLLALAATVAAAKTEHRFHSGLCGENGTGEWYSVTTFEDGNPVSVQGRGCDGIFYYQDFCSAGERGLGSDTARVRTGECKTGGDIR